MANDLWNAAKEYCESKIREEEEELQRLEAKLEARPEIDFSAKCVTYWTRNHKLRS